MNIAKATVFAETEKFLEKPNPDKREIPNHKNAKK